MKQWILKKHTSFFLLTPWDLNLPLWELDQLQLQAGGPGSSLEIWVQTGVVSGPGDLLLTGCLELMGGMYYYLTSQQKCHCPVGRAQPPLTRERHEALGQGHLALHLELAWLFKVHHGEVSRRKRESSSDAWVWWAVLSCLPKKWDDATMKMFLCLYSTPEDNLSLVRQVTEDKLS